MKSRNLAVRKTLTLEKPATMSGEGKIEFSQSDETEGSYQIVAADLEMNAGAGTSEAGDTDFKAPAMFHVTGADLTKLHNYIAGVIGANSITGTKSTVLPLAAVLGLIFDGVTAIDGIIVAHIDGDDPSTQTNARAAFAVSMANTHASSGVEYGVDLQFVPSAGLNTLLSGNAKAFKITKALFRSPNDVCDLEGSGVPTDGEAGTGAGFAGKGSRYTDYTNANLYINANTKASPTWKLVTRAA